MPFYSGQTGSVTFLLLDNDWDASDLAEVDVTAWTIQDQAVPVDITNCSSEGMRAATMGYNISWSISLPAYEGNEPDYIGIYTGNCTTMWFKVGTRTTDNYHLLQNTMILTCSPVCNSAGDVVRYVVTGQGGKITYYSAYAPDLSPPPIIPMAESAGTPSPGSMPPASAGSITYPPGL